MAARALEKELAAKQGKSDTPQLTKKQQEMLQQHLDQEQIVRERVKNVRKPKNWTKQMFHAVSFSRSTKTLKIGSKFSTKSFVEPKNSLFDTSDDLFELFGRRSNLR